MSRTPAAALGQRRAHQQGLEMSGGPAVPAALLTSVLASRPPLGGHSARRLWLPGPGLGCLTGGCSALKAASRQRGVGGRGCGPRGPCRLRAHVSPQPAQHARPPCPWACSRGGGDRDAGGLQGACAAGSVGVRGREESQGRNRVRHLALKSAVERNGPARGRRSREGHFAALAKCQALG